MHLSPSIPLLPRSELTPSVEGDGEKVKTPIIAGAICGGVMGLAWIIGFSIYFYKRYRRRQARKAGQQLPLSQEAELAKERIVITPDPAVLTGQRAPGEHAFPNGPPRHPRLKFAIFHGKRGGVGDGSGDGGSGSKKKEGEAERQQQQQQQWQSDAGPDKKPKTSNDHLEESDEGQTSLLPPPLKKEGEEETATTTTATTTTTTVAQNGKVSASTSHS